MALNTTEKIEREKERLDVLLKSLQELCDKLWDMRFELYITLMKPEPLKNFKEE